MASNGMHYHETDDEVIYVSVMCCPRSDLPVKEWQVEIEMDKTVADLKSVIFDEYFVDPELQKLCSTNNATDPGVTDKTRIANLENHSKHSDVKKVFLLPAKGKEQLLLDMVLEWAERAECLDEYEAKGCVFNKAKARGEEDELQMGQRPSILGAAQSVGGRVTRRMSAFKNRRPPQRMGKIQVSEGGEMTMDEPGDPFVDRMPFNLFFGIVCILNVLVVGLEADYTCWGLDNCKPADRMMWYAMDCVFAVLFVIELSCRLGMTGVLTYFMGDPLTNSCGFHMTNTIDFVIVVARFFDTIAFEQAGLDTKIKIISCIRIMQFARVAKLMRLVRSVRELWLIVAGLADLCKTVLWVMILLAIIFWIIGIVMTIIIGHSDDFFDYHKSYWGQHAYFDTVPKAVFSMFQIMTLSQWSSVMIRPVFEQYPAIIVVIVPFMCITTVGLLNIIVGVVVETTLQSATNNSEREAKEMQKTHAKVMESLKMVFEEADTDGGGTLDRNELHRSLKKPHVRDRLKLLDIPFRDMDALFDVLDAEGLDEIKTDHFFRGCSRLRGPAAACDLHRMSVDFSRYIGWTDSLVTSTKTTNDTLRSLLHDMESVDRDIIKGESDECDPVLGARRDRSYKKEKGIYGNNNNAGAKDNEVRGATKMSSTSSQKSRKSTRKNSLMAKTLCLENALAEMDLHT